MKVVQAATLVAALGVWARAAGAQVKGGAEAPPVMPMAGASSNWVSAQGGAIPPGARQTGYESAGFLYTCRATVDGGVQPGKVRTGFDGCFVPNNGQENSVRNYEVLTGTQTWAFSRDGNVPDAAIEVGRTRSGQTLYACRAAGAAGQLVPGKVGAGLRGCNVGVGGIEHTEAFYQVLVSR